MTNKEIIQKQIDFWYDNIQNSRRAQLTMRNWCITLVFAIIIALSTGELKIVGYLQYIVITLPILLFWFIESLQNSMERISICKVEILEKLMCQETIPELNTDMFYISLRTNVSLKQKINLLIKSIFTTETIVLFYLLLLAGVFVLIFLLSFL